MIVKPDVDRRGAMLRATQFVLAGLRVEAARVTDQALASAPPGNAGWLIPIEPLLRVTTEPTVWAAVLATRAA